MPAMCIVRGTEKILGDLLLSARKTKGKNVAEPVVFPLIRNKVG